MVMKHIMSLWIKISSLIVIGFLGYSLYWTIIIWFSHDYAPRSISQLLIVYSLPFLLIFMGWYYSPFLYYAWARNSDSEKMQSFTKLVAVSFMVLTSLSIIVNLKSVEDIFLLIPFTLFVLTLFYYGWRN